MYQASDSIDCRVCDRCSARVVLRRGRLRLVAHRRGEEHAADADLSSELRVRAAQTVRADDANTCSLAAHSDVVEPSVCFWHRTSRSSGRLSTVSLASSGQTFSGNFRVRSPASVFASVISRSVPQPSR